MTKTAAVYVGQLIRHKLFGYRGVVFDVDPVFMFSDEWYEMTARSRPPKDEPWYRVLVHDSTQETYVAQCNIEPDNSGEPIEHPEIDRYFAEFLNGRYIPARRSN